MIGEVRRYRQRPGGVSQRVAQLREEFYQSTEERLMSNLRRNDISFLRNQTGFDAAHLEELHDSYGAVMREMGSDASGMGRETFARVVRSAFPNWIVASAREMNALFLVFDRNGDASVDFCELISGFSEIGRAHV